MSNLRRILAIAAVSAILICTSGCASISLFSSPHNHYYGTEEIDQRLENLEKRVDHLEQKQ